MHCDTTVDALISQTRSSNPLVTEVAVSLLLSKSVSTSKRPPATMFLRTRLASDASASSDSIGRIAASLNSWLSEHKQIPLCFMVSDQTRALVFVMVVELPPTTTTRLCRRGICGLCLMNCCTR